MERTLRGSAKSVTKAASTTTPSAVILVEEDDICSNTSQSLEGKARRSRAKKEPLKDVTDLFNTLQIKQSQAVSSVKAQEGTLSMVSLSPRRSPRRQYTSVTVDDLASTLDHVILEEPQPVLEPATSSQPMKNVRKHQSLRRKSYLKDDVSEEESKPKVPLHRPDARLEWLRPLIDAYQRSDDPTQRISIQDWDTLLDPVWDVTKVTESSYAEVYKVVNPSGSSILKIMSLKPPKGPGSRLETSVTVDMVLSEVMIMSTMADLIGFVEFKECHVIGGRPPKAIQQAFDRFMEADETYFPRPASYHKNQLFLVLELGDAGTDVEHFEFKDEPELWDLFLGVVVALAAGEEAFGFEHRDLHEGNVCLRQTSPPRPLPKTSKHRQGYSGLEITLLDYTLSRASRSTSPSETLFLDLDADPELFTSTKLLQHQMYRRMRNWILFRAHGIHHPEFDSSFTTKPMRKDESGWTSFEPYTNVIWLWYILQYVLSKYSGDRKGKKEFMKATEECRSFLHPDVEAADGGFDDVLGVYEYCVEKGWISEDTT